MKDKTNGKLYKINTTSTKKGNDQTIIDIVEQYNLNESKKFVEKSIKKSVITNSAYSLRLYTLVSDADKKPDWKTFLDTISEENNDELMSISSSFLLFIFNTSSIFVLSRGVYGFFAISNYIKNNFGLEVISCLVKSNTTPIKSLNERKFFGDEFLTIRNFKDDFVLSYDDNFGKIYNGILAEIADSDFDKLGILKKRKNINKASINVSNSLEISSSFNLKELLNRIEKIENLLNVTPISDRVNFNFFTKVNTNKSPKIKIDLVDKIYEKCFKSFKENKNCINFFYNDINTFLKSSKLIICEKTGRIEICEIENIRGITYLEMINEIKDEILSVDKTSFRSSVNELIFQLYNSENDLINESTFIEWINTEIDLNGINYYLIDGEWYIFEKNLDNELNKEINNIDFKSLTLNNLEVWDKTTRIIKGKASTKYFEGDFNYKHRKQEKFIIADECCFNYIELADIIMIDNASKNIFLYHIKKGLGQDLRVLSSQLLNSVKTIRYNLDNDSLLDTFYDKIKKNQYQSGKIEYLENGKKVNLTKAIFKKIFKNKEYTLNFVFAVSSKKDDLKKLLLNSNSRIAKLAFINTVKEIRKFEYKLYFELIKEV